MYFNIIIINIFNHILPSFSKSRRGICSNSNAKLFCTSMFVSFAKLSTAVLVSSLYAVLGYLGCLQHSKWHKWERRVPLKPLNERNYSHVLCTYAQKCNFTFVQKCPCFLPSYIVCPCMSFKPLKQYLQPCHQDQWLHFLHQSRPLQQSCRHQPGWLRMAAAWSCSVALE